MNDKERIERLENTVAALCAALINHFQDASYQAWADSLYKFLEELKTKEEELLK